MKTTLKILMLLLVLLLMTVVMARPSTPQQEEVSFQVFYDQLSPYGQWVDYANYGYVWIPDVGADFAPYSTSGRPTPNTAGPGFRTTNGDGLRSITDDGITTIIMDGFGCPIPNGDHHGSVGEGRKVIMDGLPCSPASVSLPVLARNTTITTTTGCLSEAAISEETTSTATMLTTQSATVLLSIPR